MFCWEKHRKCNDASCGKVSLAAAKNSWKLLRLETLLKISPCIDPFHDNGLLLTSENIELSDVSKVDRKGSLTGNALNILNFPK